MNQTNPLNFARTMGALGTAVVCTAALSSAAVAAPFEVGQQLASIEAVPHTEEGIRQLFDALAGDAATLRQLAVSLEYMPRETLETIFLFTTEEQANLDALTAAEVVLLTDPFLNLTKTTSLMISNGLSRTLNAPLKSASSVPEPKYYLGHYSGGVFTGRFHLVDPWLVMELQYLIIVNGGIPTPQAVDALYNSMGGSSPLY